MNKEEIKELARESMLETLKTNLDSAMIFTYVKSLEDRIDKAIKYIDNVAMDNNRYLTAEEEKILSILRGEE